MGIGAGRMKNEWKNINIHVSRNHLAPFTLGYFIKLNATRPGPHLPQPRKIMADATHPLLPPSPVLRLLETDRDSKIFRWGPGSVVNGLTEPSLWVGLSGLSYFQVFWSVFFLFVFCLTLIYHTSTQSGWEGGRGKGGKMRSGKWIYAIEFLIVERKGLLFFLKKKLIKNYVCTTNICL